MAFGNCLSSRTGRTKTKLKKHSSMKTSCLRRGGNLYNMYSIRYVSRADFTAGTAINTLKINTICVHVIRSRACSGVNAYRHVRHGKAYIMKNKSPNSKIYKNVCLLILFCYICIAKFKI